MARLGRYRPETRRTEAGTTVVATSLHTCEKNSPSTADPVPPTGESLPTSPRRHLYGDHDSTDTFGQVIVEAQASGIPVVAVDAGGPASLIRDGHTGLLRPADFEPVAAAVVELAASPGLRHRFGADGRAAARERTWERSMAELAAGYEAALARAAAPKMTPAGPPRAAPLAPIAGGRRAA